MEKEQILASVKQCFRSPENIYRSHAFSCCAYGGRFSFPMGFKLAIAKRKDPMQMEAKEGEFFYKQTSVAVELDEHNTAHYSMLQRSGKQADTYSSPVVMRPVSFVRAAPEKRKVIYDGHFEVLRSLMQYGIRTYDWSSGYSQQASPAQVSEVAQEFLKDKLVGFITNSAQHGYFEGAAINPLKGTLIHESEMFNNRNYHYDTDCLKFHLVQY